MGEPPVVGAARVYAAPRQTAPSGRQPPTASGRTATAAAARPPRDQPASTIASSPMPPSAAACSRVKASEASRWAPPPSGASDRQSGTTTVRP